MSGSYATPYTSAPLPPASQPHGSSDLSHSQMLAQQDQQIRQQDEALSQLGRSVATLHNLGSEIHGELRSQGQLLDDLERGVDQTRDALVSQNSRLNRLMKRAKSGWLYITIGACRRTLRATRGGCLSNARMPAPPQQPARRATTLRTHACALTMRDRVWAVLCVLASGSHSGHRARHHPVLCHRGMREAILVRV